MKADLVFKSKRPKALETQEYTCQGCGYKTKPETVSKQEKGRSHMDVHHRDDDHHNNDESNFCVVCLLCHAYQHVGQSDRRSDTSPAENMGGQTAFISVPEIAATDLNLLQRAIGVALHDDAEEAIALGIYDALKNRTQYVAEEFGSFKTADFAAAFASLNSKEYAGRVQKITDLRLRFSLHLIKGFGREFMLDYPSLPLAAWAGVLKTSGRKFA